MLGVQADPQGVGIGEADVLDGHAHQSPEDVQRVFAPFQHPVEPEQRGIDIGIADAFVQGRNILIAVVAGSVIPRDLVLEDVEDDRFVDRLSRSAVWKMISTRLSSRRLSPLL